MSFFRAAAQIIGGTVENVIFRTPVSVNMNDQRIQSTGDPVDDKDAVNNQSMKKYIRPLIFTLDTYIDDTGLSSIVDTRLFGMVQIIVNGSSEGMPLGIYILSKTAASEVGSVTTVSKRTGRHGTILEFSWPPGSGIMVQKKGQGDTGIYHLKFI
jgi:hypothetical protein